MTERQQVVVVGASGFGRECLSVLEAMIFAGSDLEIIGVLDDGPSALNLERLAGCGVAYLGKLESWISVGSSDVCYVLGIGDPRMRQRLVELLDDSGARPLTAIHPNATFGAGGVISEGVVVCAGATISTNVRLGRHVHINPNATVGHDAVLFDFVSVNPAAVISGEVTVGSGVTVGAAATVLQGLSVGEETILGAGCLVTKHVPDGVVVKGIPGRWAQRV